MRYQPKINKKNVEQQGNLYTTVGKLVLIQQKEDIQFPCVSTNMHDSDWMVSTHLLRSPRKYYKPVIISETEKRCRNDYILELSTNTIKEQERENINNQPVKVLVLPQQFFSELYLESIVSGEMRDGDEVLVKCEKHVQSSMNYTNDVKEKYYIYLNPSGSPTLFPTQKKEQERQSDTQEDIHKKIYELHTELEDCPLKEHLAMWFHWGEYNK